MYKTEVVMLLSEMTGDLADLYDISRVFKHGFWDYIVSKQVPILERIEDIVNLENPDDQRLLGSIAGHIISAPRIEREPALRDAVLAFLEHEKLNYLRLGASFYKAMLGVVEDKWKNDLGPNAKAILKLIMEHYSKSCIFVSQDLEISVEIPHIREILEHVCGVPTLKGSDSIKKIETVDMEYPEPL